MFLDRDAPAYSPEETERRVEQAKRYLNDPFFQNLMDDIEERRVKLWMLSTTPQEREAHYLVLQGVYAVVRELRDTASSGRLSHVS